MSIRVPLADSTFTAQELADAAHVLQHGRLTMGEKCAEFERAFAKYTGRRFAIFTNSGSSANLLAFFGLSNPDYPAATTRRRWVPGGEVIVPALTWSTSIWPIVQAGYVPVFVDSDPLTLQMQPELVAAAVTDKTVAICVPHIMGNAVDLGQIYRIAEDHGLWVVEDCCEALGVRQGFSGLDWPIGRHSDAATYSFYFSHHITTIEGGMVTTDDANLADILRAMRAHGWIRDSADPMGTAAILEGSDTLDPRYLFVTTGFNLRPTEINGVLGLGQLKKLDMMNVRRSQIAGEFHRAIGHRPGYQTMVPTNGTKTAPFGFTIICPDSLARIDLQSHLEQNGIETRSIVAGNMCRHPAMKRVNHRVHGDLSGADRVTDCGLYIGLHPTMNRDAINHVVKTFNRYSSAGLRA